MGSHCEAVTGATQRPVETGFSPKGQAPWFQAEALEQSNMQLTAGLGTSVLFLEVL